MTRYLLLPVLLLAACNTPPMSEERTYLFALDNHIGKECFRRGWTSDADASISYQRHLSSVLSGRGDPKGQARAAAYFQQASSTLTAGHCRNFDGAAIGHRQGKQEEAQGYEAMQRGIDSINATTQQINSQRPVTTSCTRTGNMASCTSF